jgi:large subunit ribosomal protein L15
MTLRLGALKKPDGSTRSRKRLGRGPGSGTGKTCGKGHKGHQSRSGYKRLAHREGGQMPLYRKIPKRGFVNPSRREYEALNLHRLAGVTETELTADVLISNRLVSSRARRYKILGQGELDRALTVHAHAFSKTAREKIEKAGGRCEVIA